MRSRDSLRDSENNNAPMIEIFGGVFALLLVLFIIVNLFSQASIQQRLTDINEGGDYKISWEQHGSGYSIITSINELRIIETSTSVPYNNICNPSNPFVNYVKKVYSKPKQQLIFTITEGSVQTMAKARNCIRQIFPQRVISIGWIIADKELLKSINLDDIPPYIEEVINAR